MRAGKLDIFITIQRKQVTQSSSGAEKVTWTNVSTRPASIAPLLGDERFNGEQIVALEQVEFITRYASVIADLRRDDRVIYPVTNSPNENYIYDIVQASEIGRNEGIRIVAVRRPS